jgi:hypothetical protein
MYFLTDEQECAYEALDYLFDLLDEGKSLKYVMRHKALELKYYKKTLDPECWDEFLYHYENAFNRYLKQHKRFS